MPSAISTHWRSGDPRHRRDRMRRPIVLRPNDSSFPSPGTRAEGTQRSPGDRRRSVAGTAAQRLHSRHLSVVQRRYRPDHVVVAGSARGDPSERRQGVAQSARAHSRAANSKCGSTRHSTMLCADVRLRATAIAGTWITPAIRAAYGELHRLGYAHSVETWMDGELVGGLYGVSIGRMFFGESMFAREIRRIESGPCSTR